VRFLGVSFKIVHSILRSQENKFSRLQLEIDDLRSEIEGLRDEEE